jgi:cis-3-alkyl-4-acyloxetan-2-one decarboxylase
MNIDGVEIQIDGSGRNSILLLHGWPDTHRLWDPQVAALQSHYRCVRFTLPGFAPGAARGVRTLDAIVDLIHRVIERTCGGGR